MASPQSGPPPTTPTTTDEVLQQQPPPPGPESATNASGTGITGTPATAPSTPTAVLGQKKALITRALKSAAKLPKRAVRGGTTSSSANAANPTTTATATGEGGEQPTLDSVAGSGGGEGTATAPPPTKSKFRSRYKDKGGVDPTSVSRMKPKKTRRIKVFGHGKNRVDPKPDEEPLALVRVRVVGCKDLRSGDSNGLSDPFVVASILNNGSYTTPVKKNTLNPVFPAKESTFDFPLYQSVIGKMAVWLELVVWDRDMKGLRKEYLGEAAVGVEDWFGNQENGGGFAWEGDGNPLFSVPLMSTKEGVPSAGTIQLKIGLVPPPKAPSQTQEALKAKFEEVYELLVKKSRPSLVSAPPTEGVGTIRSVQGLPQFLEDDGGLSSSSSEDEGLEEEEEDSEEEEEGEGEFDERLGDNLLATPTPGGTTPTPRPVSPRVKATSSKDNSAQSGLVSQKMYEPPEEQPVSSDVAHQPSSTAPIVPSSQAPTPVPLPAPVPTVIPKPKWKRALTGGSSSPAPSPRAASPSSLPPLSTATAQPSPGTPITPVSIVPPSPIAPTATPKTGLIPKIKRLTGLSSSSSTSTSSSTATGGILTPTSTTAPVSLASATLSTSAPTSLTSSPVSLPVPLPGVGLGISGALSDAEAGVIPVGGGLSVDEKHKKKKKFSRKSWGGSKSDAEASSGGVATPVGAGSGNDVSGQSGQDQVPGQYVGEEIGGKKKKKKKEVYKLGTENDIVGIVMLEIQGAKDLPKLKNVTHIGWDMDPFVVISFGKKVFRTRVIRHSLSPVWDEKLLFHVRRYETSFRIQLAILDWDKLSSNDHIGDASLDVNLLVKDAPQPNPETGLYDLEALEGNTGNGKEMMEFSLPLNSAEKVWEGKFNPVITFKAKYQPYDALRQKFWRTYLKQYDTDDVGHLSHLELTSMLDSLGSTLSRTTLDGFWTRFNKNPEEDDLTADQVIICLEEELGRPESEKKRIKHGEPGSSDAATPVVMASDREGKEIPLGELDFAGPSNVTGRNYVTEPAEMALGHVAVGADSGAGSTAEDRLVPGKPVKARDLSFGSIMDEDYEEGEEDEEDEEEEVSGSTSSSGLEGSGGGSTPAEGVTPDFKLTLPEVPAGGIPASPTTAAGSGPSVTFAAEPEKGTKKKRRMRFRKTKEKEREGDVLAKAKKHKPKSKGDGTPDSPASDSSSDSQLTTGTTSSSESVERVINVKNCPLCHRPRMNSKAEMDIITHLAVCASQDWNKVDKIVVGNFVTASQAQRKWYTKLMTKMSSGDYRLGANSANIIVQNRMTGQLEEEKMQVYVRLGIRLLYKGAKGRMEGHRAKGLLKSLSIKQGTKYDAPESASQINGFIDFHQLKRDEILDPLDSFRNFNEFFYRKLKPEARPVDEPDNPNRLVSGADCRLMAFESVSEATRLWIKGREFSVARLLGDTYKDEAEKYIGGALVIFRLAPQDYHRFHSPVDGVIGKMTYISGEYYTVNPQAIRTTLDVYGENARKIVPIDSPQFGRVMSVCVGAMMVGSIQTTLEEGQDVKRGQEFGYFAFGGSTIVTLFERGAVEWDEDLLINGRASLETLVRVGMGIGRKPSTSA